MEVTRKIERTYEAEFYPDAFDCTIGHFVETRERLRLPAQQFKRCFLCGRHLSMDRKPIVISVSGKGNRFACDTCYNKSKEGNPDEKTEL